MSTVKKCLRIFLKIAYGMYDIHIFLSTTSNLDKVSIF